MKDWYDNLETREQAFVMVGAFFVVIALIYGFLWSPLDRNQKAAAASVDNWQRSLAELQPLRSLAQIKQEAKIQTKSALIEFLDRQSTLELLNVNYTIFRWLLKLDQELN